VRHQLYRASTSRRIDDGHRESPMFNSLGDDNIPCRWWHPDMGPRCARCGSGRADLHDGWWGTDEDATDEPPKIFSSLGAERHGIPWNDREQSLLGLDVEPKWWHQAAGYAVRD
jgi:hypothetical protein